MRFRKRHGALYGKPLHISAAAESRYADALREAVTQMRHATERGLRELHADDGPHHGVTVALDASLSDRARALMNAMAERFQTLFASIAPDLAAKMTADVNAASKASVSGSLRAMSEELSIKASRVVTGELADTVQAAIAANVALIKSIPQQYFEKVQGEVFRSIQTGQGLQDVASSVEAIGVVTERRARLIARDQVSKATSSINAARLKASGIKKFEWLHSAGGREPRPLHIDVLNGRTFSFSNPPVIQEDPQERGLPGQLINCRCVMIPVIDMTVSEDDEAGS